jgi:hypothetical protein
MPFTVCPPKLVLDDRGDPGRIFKLTGGDFATGIGIGVDDPDPGGAGADVLVVLTDGCGSRCGAGVKEDPLPPKRIGDRWALGLALVLTEVGLGVVTMERSTAAGAGPEACK